MVNLISTRRESAHRSPSRKRSWHAVSSSMNRERNKGLEVKNNERKRKSVKTANAITR